MTFAFLFLILSSSTLFFNYGFHFSHSADLSFADYRSGRAADFHSWSFLPHNTQKNWVIEANVSQLCHTSGQQRNWFSDIKTIVLLYTECGSPYDFESPRDYCIQSDSAHQHRNSVRVNLLTQEHQGSWHEGQRIPTQTQNGYVPLTNQEKKSVWFWETITFYRDTLQDWRQVLTVSVFLM